MPVKCTEYVTLGSITLSHIAGDCNSRISVTRTEMKKMGMKSVLPYAR